MEVTRHFTATTFVVYGDRVLLHRHRKLSLWLPVGGHIERDELPEAAAFREVREETGLAVRLYDADPPLSAEDAEFLVRPAHVVLEDINPFHQHIDLIYFALAETDRLTPADGEAEEFRWLTRAELADLEMPGNVRLLAERALDVLGS